MGKDANGDLFHGSVGAGDEFAGGFGNPIFVEDLLGDVLVDVVNNFGSEHSKDDADGEEVGIVEVVNLSADLPGHYQDTPGDEEEAAQAGGGARESADFNAIDLFLLEIAGSDEEDFETVAGQTAAFLDENANVIPRMGGGEVRDSGHTNEWNEVMGAGEMASKYP